MSTTPEQPIPDEFIIEARNFIAAEVSPDVRWQYLSGRHDGHAAVKAVARAIMAERERNGWQPIETAPKDGKHCILAVLEPGGFIYSVQGVYHAGQWDAVHRDNVEPLYWVPNVLLPATFLKEGE